MENFSIQAEPVSQGIIIRINGYFNLGGGEALTRQMTSLLDSGSIRFCIDFSACSSISSPGLAQLMELTFLVVDDFQGKIVFCGLNAVIREFFEMTGIFLNTTEASSLEQGLAKLAED